MEKPVKRLSELRVKIFSDGADLDAIAEAARIGVVRGFTTNPTLMVRSGIINYLSFATEVVRLAAGLPVSFEVFADDFPTMYKQAIRLSELGSSVYVKIPVTNSRGEPSTALIGELCKAGLKLNITAVFSPRQVREVAAVLNPKIPAIVSIFAGRIADSGRDPLPIMQEALRILQPLPHAELLWASPREALNIMQADTIGCHIITVTPDLLAKAANFGRNLEEFSLETVRMFYRDGVKCGFTIHSQNEE
jgi:transaldolase